MYNNMKTLLEAMYKLNESSNKRRIKIDSLVKLCPHIETDLESRTENEDYESIYKRFKNSKSGYISLSWNDLDLISYMYENNNNDINHDRLTRLLYGKQK